jgi:two-component system chemotaxis response regulator CheB
MLSADTGCRVVEGAHGAPLEAGTVVLIPGGRDGMVARQPGGGYALRLVRVDSSVHPSGNALLESAAMVGLAPAGIVLTGMGEDGARGAAALQRRRAPVLVQSPASCVVDGMPCAALAAAPGARAVELAEMAVRLRAWSAGTTVTGG